MIVIGMEAVLSNNCKQGLLSGQKSNRRNIRSSMTSIESDYLDYIYNKKLGTDKSLPPADQIDRVAVYYKLYRSGVDRVMQPLLDEIVQLMVDNPEIKIRLVGHIDQNEADESKVKPDLATLGDRRAKFVKGYLTKRGVDASRITATDAGSTEHADAGEGLIPDAKNRRVGFEVVR